MKYKILILTVLLLGAINSQTQTKSSFVNTVKGISDTPPEGYVPPLVSNGSLSMLIDYKGGQTQQKYANLTPGIYWAGRKYGPVPDELIPFGHFQQALIVNGKEYKDPVSWEQTLDAEKAIVTCKNDYGNDLSVETVIFTHMDHDLIVIKKKITSKSSDIHAAEIALKYQFTQPGDANVLPRRVKSECKFDEKSQSVRFQYEADGHALRLFKGVISLFADKQTEAYIDNQMVYMSAKMDLSKDKTAEITYYLLFSDSMDGDDYLERANELESKIQEFCCQMKTC